MNDKLRVTIKIADAEPIHFEIDRDEEIVYRKAEFHVNKLWADWRQAHKNKSSQDVLARVALAFAELYYRKSDELENQARLIDSFEKQLDDLLLEVD
ncbi:MAG: cell division protein ZapA [Bacteroides sp.]|nr:cell division protein ZapA [Bacteroides sp.]